MKVKFKASKPSPLSTNIHAAAKRVNPCPTCNGSGKCCYADLAAAFYGGPRFIWRDCVDCNGTGRSPRNCTGRAVEVGGVE